MSRRLRSALFLFFCFVPLSFAATSVAEVVCGFDEKRILRTVEILAHPALEGRGTGSNGFDLAGLFLRRELEMAGIEPLPSLGNSYFQEFVVLRKYKENLEFSDLLSRNVLGYISGTEPGEFIIIGAHYDHLGIVGGKLHPGADDNASGTVAALEIARALGEAKRAGVSFRKNIIIAFWGAEEKGLLGSKYFVNSGIVPLDSVAALFNFDMVGRNNPNFVFVGGAEIERKGQKLENLLLKKLLLESNLKLDEPMALDFKNESRMLFRSDTRPFLPVPILYFFSGRHADYHKPTDTADKINPQKIKKISCLAFDVLMRLATGDLRPVYTEKEN